MSTARSRAFGHDLVHGVLHLDGKIWRTLPLLAWRPGELTRRYVDGERAKFVSPMAMFLFSVFLMFARAVDRRPVAEQPRRRFRRGRATGARDRAHRIRARPCRGTRPPGGAGARRDREGRERPPGVRRGARPRGGHGAGTGRGDRPGAPWNGSAQRHRISSTGWPRLDHGIEKAQRESRRCCSTSCSPTPTNSPGLLIPISVPFVWLLFFWTPPLSSFYDHTVFVTYSIAFMTPAGGGADDPRLRRSRHRAIGVLGVALLRAADPHVPAAASGAYQLSWCERAVADRPAAQFLRDHRATLFFLLLLGASACWAERGAGPVRPGRDICAPAGCGARP